ncbi:hypothetical protein BJX68DRAFT_273582 [Aspergillus pseudodeflectus]|uniref:Uncharacterized protein n=1 Tax=Aspergillus pseudodeflectus TaxID=176178 RepID=A0ABR4J853_9EURO
MALRDISPDTRLWNSMEQQSCVLTPYVCLPAIGGITDAGSPRIQERDILLLKEELAQKDQEFARLRQNETLYTRKDAMMESFRAIETRQEGDASLLKEELSQRDQEIDRLSQEIVQLKQNEVFYMKKDAVLESFVAMEARQEGNILSLKEELAQRSQENTQLSQEIAQLKQNEALFLVMEARQEEDISFVKKELAQNSQEIAQLKQNEMLYMRRNAVDGVPSSSLNSHALETMLRHVMDRLDAVEQKYPTLPKKAQAMTRETVEEKPNSSINAELLQALVKNAQRRLDVVEDRYAILQNEFVALQSSLGSLEVDRAMVGIPHNVSRRLEVVEASYEALLETQKRVEQWGSLTKTSKNPEGALTGPILMFKGLDNQENLTIIRAQSDAINKRVQSLEQVIDLKLSSY